MPPLSRRYALAAFSHAAFALLLMPPPMPPAS
jgi:hypothetical protein